MNKNIALNLFVFMGAILTPQLIIAQTTSRQTEFNQTRYYHRQTLIYLRTDPSTKMDVYYDSMGRVATPARDTFAINISPGTVLYLSPRHLTVIDERNVSKEAQTTNQQHNQYEQKAEVSALLGYYLGIASGKK